MPAWRNDGRRWQRLIARPYTPDEWRAVRWGWWIQAVPVMALSLLSLGLYPTLVFTWWQDASGKPWPRRFAAGVGCTALVVSVVGWVVAVPVTRRWYVLHRHRRESEAWQQGRWWARHVRREAIDAVRSRTSGVWKPGRITRWVGWLLAAGFTLWAVVCPFANDHRAGCWFLPPIVMSVYVVLLRPRVIARRDGVRVRNFVRTAAVDWDDIRLIRVVPHSPAQLVRVDGTVVRCCAAPLNLVAIIQRRRSHADEVADDLARRAADHQGRSILELGGASTFTDEERAAIAKEFGWRALVSMIGFGLASGD